MARKNVRKTKSFVTNVPVHAFYLNKFIQNDLSESISIEMIYDSRENSRNYIVTYKELNIREQYKIVSSR